MPFAGFRNKVRCAVLVSTLWITSVAAHEVVPTIGELEVSGETVTLFFRMNAEAFIAGIDLDGLQNTNATDGSETYDALRALPPGALAVEMTGALPRFLSGVTLKTKDGAAIPLALQDFRAGDLGDVELPRASFLTLSGDIPKGTEALTLAWGKGYGALILRELAEEDPYTGFLSGGGETPPIAVDTGGGFLNRLFK